MRLWALTAALFGCESTPQNLALPGAPHQSLLIAVETKDERRLVAAEDAETFNLALEGAADAVHALVYDRSLTAIGLTAGRVTPVEDGVPLPSPQEQFIADLANGATSFTPMAAPPAWFADLRVPCLENCAPTRCPDLTLSDVEIPIHPADPYPDRSQQRVTVLLQTSPSRGLMAFTEGAFYEIDDLGTATFVGASTAAVRSGLLVGGDLVVGHEDGRILRHQGATPSSPATELANLGCRVTSLAAWAEVIFAATGCGDVARLEGQDLRTFRSVARLSDRGRILPLSADEAVFVVRFGTVVERIVDGALVRDRTPGELEYVTTIFRDENGDPTIAAKSGFTRNLLRRSGDAWDFFGESFDAFQDVFVAEAVPGGFLYGASPSWVGVQLPIDCQPFGTVADPERLARLTDQTWLLSGKQSPRVIHVRLAP